MNPSLNSNTTPETAPSTAPRENRFDWPVCSEAEALLLNRIDAFLARNRFANQLAGRMRAEQFEVRRFIGSSMEADFFPPACPHQSQRMHARLRIDACMEHVRKRLPGRESCAVEFQCPAGSGRDDVDRAVDDTRDHRIAVAGFALAFWFAQRRRGRADTVPPEVVARYQSDPSAIQGIG